MIVITGVSNDVAECVKDDCGQKSWPYFGLLTPVKNREVGLTGEIPESIYQDHLTSGICVHLPGHRRAG